jgi:uncharacterized metal-binding protein
MSVTVDMKSAVTETRPFLAPLQRKRFLRMMRAAGDREQAAAVMEAVELGSRVLLLDEDTCAANFMSRDGRMRVGSQGVGSKQRFS